VIENLLVRFTKRLPCRLIDGPGGEPYLERYYLFGIFGWHAYLHHFVASDPDRGLHDHPWRHAVSLVLAGGYRERRLERNRAEAERRLRPLQINRLRGEDFHRVLLNSGESAWTLFVHGPRAKGWGFLRGGAYKSMAQDKDEFRHRNWWKQAPRGRAIRALRRTDIASNAAHGVPCPVADRESLERTQAGPRSSGVISR